MALPEAPKPLSWRDPDGFVVNADGRILRAVAQEKSGQVLALLDAPWFTQLVAAGSIPETTVWSGAVPIANDAEQWVWFEHKVLSFPCYPHEITALQLYDSAHLTLEISLLAAQNGWNLKDASAWNVLHDNGRPVFVDILSFERRTGTSAWIAYGQFVRHFLLPLMAHRKLGITPAEIFLINRDGMTPEKAYELLRGTGLASMAALEFVVLPRWLATAGARKIALDSVNPPKAPVLPGGMDLLLHTLMRLQRKLTKLCPDRSTRKSVWKEYEEDRSHYSDADIDAKKNFVRVHLQKAVKVLDMGCNAGEFSLLAAECGKAVVATDFDHGALSRLYERVRGTSHAVAPVLLNIGRPTPAVGWQNGEVRGFMQRAAGRFDCVLVLGLIHHLLVSERCTLPMLVDLLDGLGAKFMILEWIDPLDTRFQQVAGVNAGLYKNLSAVSFEASLSLKFRMEAKLLLPCATRVMYLWSK